MGWCSGTELFDQVVDVLLDKKQSTEDRIKAVIEAFENADWDCQPDSKYFEHPIVSKIFNQIHPGWYEAEEE